MSFGNGSADTYLIKTDYKLMNFGHQYLEL